ncbi:patatin-like phospholipase domain-containing protein 7 [Lineus longissimus]|uniref:patatin-like phospholipase domain-containing protein 7 n=1 Tax=Lineus longissimus TaxID=88925 RepID=UPI00315D4F0A
MESASDGVGKLQQIQENISQTLSNYDLTRNIIIGLFIGAVTAAVIIFIALRKIKAKVLTKLNERSQKPRFRKRDKIVFYGKKMLRKVKSFTRKTMDRTDSSGRRVKKRQIVMKFARRLLRMRRDSIPQLANKEPPQSFLETERLDTLSGETILPSEVLYMLKSVRVFGHFEKPLFMDLCRHVESQRVQAGDLLFKVGDKDDSIFVVQSGKLNVFVTDADGTEISIKVVETGDSVHSLLSILDAITGHLATYKTVSAVAMVDSTVLRLPADAFIKIFDNYPESLVRVVQVIMVRLQRVTFMALHNYLGLSSELIRSSNQVERSASVSGAGLGPRIGKVMKEAKSSSSSDGDRVIRVVNYDEESVSSQSGSAEASRPITIPSRLTTRRGSDSNSITTSPRRGRYFRRQSYVSDAVIARPSRHSDEVDGETAPTDFEAALSQARLTTFDDQGDPLSIGTPPSRQTFLESDVSPTKSRTERKRVSITEDVSYIEDQKPERPETDEDIIRKAKSDLLTILDLQDANILDDKLKLQSFRAGVILTKQGDQDASLYFVVTGNLQCAQQVVGHQEKEQISLFLATPGELVGGLAVLTGEPSFFTIRSKTESKCVVITKKDFYSIIRVQPKVVLNTSHTIVNRMSPFVRQIDFALDWMQIEAGRPLYRQGDVSDCIYIILNGRLRNIVKRSDGKKELVGEYGRGELIGIVEVLTQTERATTVLAVRDTELAKIPSELLNMIKHKYPQVVTRLIHLLGKRILGTLQENNRLPLREKDSRSTVANLATVAVLPASDDVPLNNFTLELQFALNGIGPTLRLTSEIIQKRLGPAALENVNEYRLSSWLGQQEDLHRMVLYQCDMKMTAWTQQCIRQADCILIVGRADGDHSVGNVEKQLENIGVRAQKELILLHQEDAEKPDKRMTVLWLNARGWCSSHHHIRCPKRVFSRKSQEKALESYKRLFESTEPDRMSDFSRLARFLTGTSIGLVLGGGGARGIAHVGMIRALLEAGIPIDMVGGTSIGSIMGGIWAEETNLTRFTQRAREWSKDMNSLWKKVLDLTYPITSMMSGSAFNKSIEGVFRDRQIEDLWIPYFCVTTDISASKMRVHTSGSLWRYIRASMSLSGYLPPLCDPVDGHLLLDGGYVNNLPADIMRGMGAQTIFAVDVGSQDDDSLDNYGDQLSGWWLLWKRWNPWASKVKVPDMNEIQGRLAYVSCVSQLEHVKSSDYCEYVRPPIDRYATLQFGAFDEIHDVGYNHGKTMFQAWQKTGIINELFKEKKREEMDSERRHSGTSIKGGVGSRAQAHAVHNVPVEACFQDLAELVSRIEKPKFFVGSDDASRNRRLHRFWSEGHSIQGLGQYRLGTQIDNDEYDDYYGDEEDGCTSEPEMGRERPLKTRMLRPLSEGESADDDSENTGDDLEEFDEEDEDDLEEDDDDSTLRRRGVNGKI